MNKIRLTWNSYPGITIFTFLVVAFVGWIANIVKLAYLNEFSGEMALRIIGILFAPLGAIYGFF